MHTTEALPTETNLTEKQQAFVSAYVASGGRVAKAAEAAGYAAPNEGSRLLRNPNVLKAIQQAVMDDLGSAAVSALSAVKRLVRSANSEYVKLEAAKDILDRAGFKPPERVAVAIAGDLKVSFDIAPQSGLVISNETDQSS
jgi:phage terminase small subunit